MYYQLQTDERLIELLSQSNAKAFDEIYRRYWVVVFRYAVCKVATQEIAEDLCQDVFVSLWQRRNVVVIQNLEAYLVQATKYGVLNHIRLKMKSQKYFDLADTTQTSDNDTENSINLNGLMVAWEKAISKLPDKTQQVFRLSKFNHFSNKEIAKQLDLTEKTVEYHITKSYKILRLQLKDFILLVLAYFASK